MARVERHLDGALVASVKSWPAATALELCRGRVQRQPACPARKVPFACLRHEFGILALVRCIGALASDDGVLFGSENFVPLVFGLDGRTRL